MASWTLSPQYKKSAVENMFFYKDGAIIKIEQGFRWATFTVDSDERPLTDYELKNQDGYELGCIDNDECWEMQDMTDGCWLDIEKGNDKVTDEELEAFQAAWEEDSYEGVEALGWSNDDTEYYYHGPLELVNEDTGAVYQGEPDEPQEKTEEQLKQELEELVATMPDVPKDVEPVVTDWYPASTAPVRNGRYEVTDNKNPNWPFPQYANWDGKKWDHADIVSWRGLANNPAE